MDQHTTQFRSSRPSARLDGRIWAALARPAPVFAESGAERFWPVALAPGILLISAVAIGLAVTFFAKFDATDEAIYLYFMSRPKLAGLVFIDNIAGTAGLVFHNNIIVWRFIGLALLIMAATLFADGIHRLLPDSVPSHAKASRITAVAFAVAGALLFYAYGPPTFSYRLASSAGILGAFGALIRSLFASSKPARHAWIAVGSLCAVLMLAGRISVAVTYPIAGLPLIWLAARRFGWGQVGVLVALHVFYGVLWTALVCTLVGYETVASIAQILAFGATSGTYRPPSILGQHLHDVLEALVVIPSWSAQAILGAFFVSAVVTLASVVAGRVVNLWRVFASSMLWAAAALPVLIYVRYAQEWARFVSEAKAPCLYAHMIACQGPTPAFGGAIFIHTLGAQILCLLALAGVDRLLYGPTRRGGKAGAPSATEAWVAVLFFLIAVTPASSLYTNTGWFYHAILSLGPLFLASYVAIGFVPLRLAVIPSYLPGTALALLSGLTVLLVAHNHLFFPHRVEGNFWAQTQKLEEPPSLRGLRINPHTAMVFARVKSDLAHAGFDRNRDVVLAAYALPGVVVAAGARGLGAASLHGGHPGVDRVNCELIERDPVDLHAIGRVFIIQNLPFNPVLVDCVKARGIDLDAMQALDSFSIGTNRSLTISVAPVR